jgi:glucose-6-phosphate isomerase
MPIVTASQAWAILTRHAKEEIQSLRLQELCHDNPRVSSLVTVHSSEDSANTLILDISRQRMTLETLNHLLHLAQARGCIDLIQRDLPYHHPPNSLYMALRAPLGSTMKLNWTDDDDLHDNQHPRSITDSNACASIHSEWDRIQRLSEGYRHGQLRGITGSVLKDVIVVGSGVVMKAIEFVYDALLQDPTGSWASRDGLSELLSRRTFTTTLIDVGHRRLRLVSSLDTLATTKAIDDLDPASTLIISLAMTGHEETGLSSRLLKNWLQKSLSGSGRKVDMIFSKHMLLVTGNDRLYHASKPESVFSVPSFCRSEPFCNLSTMSLLPLSIIFGWNLIHDGLLTGAHNMDIHLVESSPRHNIPLLLALVDLWNDAFLPSTTGRLIQNFGEAFSAYGSLVASLESHVCGGPSNPAFSNSSCGLVMASRDSYDRSLYQASEMVPLEVVASLDPPIKRDGLPHDDVLHHHDALLCSMFAHVDELAITSNRSSTLLLCGRLNSYICGQLIALAEHRAIIKAKLWNMTPLFPTIDASSLRTPRNDKLKEDLIYWIQHQKNNDENNNNNDDDDDDDIDNSRGVNLSTKTLLNNYASRTKAIRFPKADYY